MSGSGGCCRNQLLPCLLSWMEGGWSEEREHLAGWGSSWEGRTMKWSTKEGTAQASADGQWRPQGVQLESKGVTWVCWQCLEDPRNPKRNSREERPRDINRDKSGIESKCLGLFHYHFYSRYDLLLVGFALLGNSWEQLQDRPASGKRGDRGSWRNAWWTGDSGKIGTGTDKQVRRSSHKQIISQGSLKSAYAGQRPSTVLQKPEC